MSAVARLARGAEAVAAAAPLVLLAALFLLLAVLAAVPRAAPPWVATPTEDAPARDRAAPVLSVPRARGTLVIDGDTDDPGWSGFPAPARTGAFWLDNGRAARPDSEARLVWQDAGGDAYLYLALYAADEDIRSRTPGGAEAGSSFGEGSADAFRVTFVQGEVESILDVSPDGAVTASRRSPGDPAPRAWDSGVHVGFERDGTLDDPSDTDEEWLIEMALPLAAIGMRGEPGETVGLTLRRCDSTATGAPVCASWGEGDVRGRIVLR